MSEEVLEVKANQQQSVCLVEILNIYKDAGYFPIHREKLEYEELSEQYSPEDPNGNRVLQVALMRRAMETVKRVLRLREEKPPLQQMVREGVVGESLWEKLLAAEAEIELEIQEVEIDL